MNERFDSITHCSSRNPHLFCDTLQNSVQSPTRAVKRSLHRIAIVARHCSTARKKSRQVVVEIPRVANRLIQERPISVARMLTSEIVAPAFVGGATDVPAPETVCCVSSDIWMITFILIPPLYILFWL